MITVAALGPNPETVFPDYVNQAPGCLLGFCCLGASYRSSQAVSQSTIEAKHSCLYFVLYLIEAGGLCRDISVLTRCHEIHRIKA